MMLLAQWPTQQEISTLSLVIAIWKYVNTFTDIMEGEDINDSNCIDFGGIQKVRHWDRVLKKELTGTPLNFKDLKVGVVEEFDIEELDQRNRNLQNQVIQLLEDRGAYIKRISIPLLKYSLPFHFTLIPAEAASNFARYDGLKYGYQPEFDSLKRQDLFGYISKSKSEGFGLNVKRRMLLGNFLLSSRLEDFNQKVIEAKQIRRLLIQEYCESFENNDLDFIISPTTLGEEPPKINDILNESLKKHPVYEYKLDYYTAFPNATGTPAITMPIQEDQDKYQFPSSVKIQGYFGEDYHLLRVAHQLEKLFSEVGIADKR